MSFATLKSDGTTGGTALVTSELRAIAGEELWLPPGSSAGVVVTEHTALTLSALLAAVNVLATDLSIFPLELYKRTPDGGRQTVTDHPVPELLSRSPDGETTPFRWRQSVVSHALLHGNGTAEIERTGRGSPYALHLLDPETTRVRRKEGALGYQTGSKWIPAYNVIHIAGIGFDGITGYSFVRLLRQAIGLGIAAETYGADYFANGSEPGGVLETPNKLDSIAIKNLRESWEFKHRGPGNRHRVAVLEQGTKFNPTSTDPQKSQLIETRKFQLVDVIRAWRVPPHKVGDYSEAHLANLEESNLDYLMTALMGWLVMIEQEFNFKLLTRAEWKAGLYLAHDYNALLRGDIKSRFEAYTAALLQGWMNRDEVRRRENMNPIGKEKGGDLYTVQSQNVPLDTIGRVTEPDGDESTSSPATDAAAAEPAPVATDAPVANTAMNGAQITSLVEITEAVAAGTLPKDSAKGLILASFPILTADQVAAILDPLEGFTQATPAATSLPLAPPTEPTPDASQDTQPAE